MALENLKSVFNNIYKNDVLLNDDLPLPSIDTIGEEHSYGSNQKFDSINNVLQPDGTYQPYGKIPINASAQDSPMSKKLILSEAEPTINHWSGYENQQGVKIKDTGGIEKFYEGLIPGGGGETDSIRFRHNEGANIGKNNILGAKDGDLTLESIYDPSHGAGSVAKIRPAGVGSTKYLDIRASQQEGVRIGAGNQREPYVVNPIPNQGKNSIKGGYDRDFLPYNASLDDIERFIKYTSSSKGLISLLKENVTNALIGDSEFLQIPPNPTAGIMAPAIPVPNTGFLNFYQQTIQGAGLGSIRKPFKVQYSDRAGKIVSFANQGDSTFGAEQLEKITVPEADGVFGKLAAAAVQKLKEVGILTLEKAAQVPKFGNPTSFIKPSLDFTGKRTTQDKIGRSYPITTEAEDKVFNATKIKKGDFYVKIKDLRNGKILYFRGFVNGINENVTPTFNPTQYIGRSEDVYVYQKAERDLSFNLKVYPQNESEFKAQYEKMNSLTSLAYPKYLDEFNPMTGIKSSMRMQPPFTELYMGHIGTRKEGQFGFIKSLTYTVPEGGDWDAYSALPRMFEIAISYQILNRRPPQLGTRFYKAHGQVVKV